MRCAVCGTQIKPWFEVCFECYSPVSEGNGRIPEPILARDFMQKMGIDRW